MSAENTMTEQLENISILKREDFPFFQENPGWVYLDTSATALTPRCVTDSILEYYHRYSANIHRGIYGPANEVSEKVERTREKIIQFVHAENIYGVVFTRNTTESLNLLAYSLSKAKHELDEYFSVWNGGIQKDDVIVLSESEHHSNIVPWQQIALDKGAKLFYIPVQKNGMLDFDAFNDFINNTDVSRIKILSLASVSNITGIHHDLTPVLGFAQKNGSVLIIDGAQEVPHKKVFLEHFSLNGHPVFYVFSGHKLYGPTGIGALVGVQEILNKMPPYQSGGNMIEKVEKEKSHYARYPYRFEAGTLNIAAIFGLNAALEYMKKTDFDFIKKRETQLTYYALEKAKEYGYQIYGPSLEDRLSGRVEAYSVLSMNIPEVHHYDAGSFLAEGKIALRTGHHCGQIFMEAMQIPGTLRMSLSFLNLFSEVDQFFVKTEKIKEIFL